MNLKCILIYTYVVKLNGRSYVAIEYSGEETLVAGLLGPWDRLLRLVDLDGRDRPNLFEAIWVAVLCSSGLVYRCLLLPFYVRLQ